MLDMVGFVQLLLSGLLLGGIYALVAVGLALCFGVLGVLNLAHGSFLVLAAFGYQALSSLGPEGALAGMVLVPLGVSVLSLVLFRLFLHGPVERSIEDFLGPALLITLGLALILEESTSSIWGHSMAGVVSQFTTLRWRQLYVPGSRLVVLLFMLATTAGLQLWLGRTDSGRRVRCLAQEPVAATLLGISRVRVTALAFTLASCLAAVAGIFYVSLFTVTAHLGLPLTLKALFIVVISGGGSFTRPLAGGLLLGLLETLLGGALGSQWAGAAAIGLLLALLCWRPQGVFMARRDLQEL